MYQKIDSKSLNLFLKVRKSLLSNNSTIEISDFGAGSKIFKDNKRTIAQLVKNVSISPQKAKILFKIIHYFQPKNILELGTCLGLGTYTMHLASKNANIETVEGCENLALLSQQFFTANNCKTIKVQQQIFSNYFKNLSPLDIYDAVLIDGNHSYKATLEYFYALIPHLHNDSLLIFDDIHWSKEMNQAWNEIIKNKWVTVSIDFFYFGLIFIRKEQNKQHFILRT
ncbi:MAG: O-methyltransferase [Flavobacterium sp.]